MKLGRTTIDFKPEFGNTSHLKVLEMAGVIQADIKLLAKKREARKDEVRLRKKIIKQMDELKSYIAYLKGKAEAPKQL